MNNRQPYIQTARQLLSYGFIGLVTNGLGYLGFLVLVYCHLSPKLAMSLLYLSCASLSYFSNWRLTFHGAGHFNQTSLRFILVHFIGYCLNLIILFIFADSLNFPYYTVQAVAIPIIAVYLFVVFKLFVFKQGENEFTLSRNKDSIPVE